MVKESGDMRDHKTEPADNPNVGQAGSSQAMRSILFETESRSPSKGMQACMTASVGNFRRSLYAPVGPLPVHSVQHIHAGMSDLSVRDL